MDTMSSTRHRSSHDEDVTGSASGSIATATATAATPAIISNGDELQSLGVCKASIPSDRIPLAMWAAELSQVTPLILTSQGDGEYAFYRNICDEEDFPFDAVLESDIGTAILDHFGISNLDEIRLDDAFCVHYNTEQHDSSGSKHMDPCDITVNMCFEKSQNVTGSQVQFHGTQPLVDSSSGVREDLPAAVVTPIGTKEDNFRFLVDQEEGFATIHWGHHPHETLPLLSGSRTNIILTYCYTDAKRSDVGLRTCYY